MQAKSLASAGGLSNITFLQQDAELAVFEPASFDAILCSSGMIYLQDHQRATQQFHLWLADGGSLHFNTPQVYCYMHDR